MLILNKIIDEVDVKLCGVLVEGDQGALEYSYNIVKRGVPLVVMNDSGKMADAISFLRRSREKKEKNGASSNDLEHEFVFTYVIFKLITCFLLV